MQRTPFSPNRERNLDAPVLTGAFFAFNHAAHVLRKFHKSKKLKLSCPYCGHEQEEPTLVISSYCQKCGEHFRVQKGVAVTGPGLKVSGIAEVRKTKKRQSESKRQSSAEVEDGEGATNDSWQMSSDNPEGKARALTHPEPDEEDDEEVGISAGAFFGLVDEEDLEEAEQPGGGISKQSVPKEDLAHGSVGALIETQGPAISPEKDKMPPNYVPPEKRRRDGAATNFKVRCYRCYHIQPVSRFAKSTQCERCSAYISLANYEIKAVKSHTLRTRGDIVITKKGGLQNCEIACHHLTVNGTLDARVDCTGDVIFRRSATVKGPIYCRRIIVEKKCEVKFPDGVMTERADVYGQCLGNVTCSGTITVFPSGTIVGDARAVTVNLKDTGSITGETIIDPETSTDLPLKMGFNPSIIS